MHIKKTFLILIVAVFVAFIFCYQYIIFPVKKTTLPLPTIKPIASATYSCAGGKTLQAYYFKGTPVAVEPGQMPVPTGSVHLKLSDGRELNLVQTVSADGGRYTNSGEAFIFWSKGNGALVDENKTEIQCVQIAGEPVSSGLSQIYSSPDANFSIRFSTGTSIDDKYQYQLAPGKKISGVKFTIPTALAEGTNLSKESYLSIENLPLAQGKDCVANLFLQTPVKAQEMELNGTTFSVASSTDAAAGNRYEEIVFAEPYSNPCRAMRYFIHYSAFENYPAGAVKEFDRASLLKMFDGMRGTFVLNQ